MCQLVYVCLSIIAFKGTACMLLVKVYTANHQDLSVLCLLLKTAFQHFLSLKGFTNKDFNYTFINIFRAGLPFLQFSHGKGLLLNYCCGVLPGEMCVG